jgi:hypothetical protein
MLSHLLLNVNPMCLYPPALVLFLHNTTQDNSTLELASASAVSVALDGKAPQAISDSRCATQHLHRALAGSAADGSKSLGVTGLCVTVVRPGRPAAHPPGRDIVVLLTTSPSTPVSSMTAAMSALSASVRSGATLTSRGGGPEGPQSRLSRAVFTKLTRSCSCLRPCRERRPGSSRHTRAEHDAARVTGGVSAHSSS